MAHELVPDALWERMAPLRPVPKKKKPGRPRVDDRAAFEAIVFVRKTGISTHFHGLSFQADAPDYERAHYNV